MRIPPPITAPPAYRIWNGKTMHTVFELIWQYGGLHWYGPGVGSGYVWLNPDAEDQWGKTPGWPEKPKRIDMLMQCTHIKDNKGTLIYEGDILRFDIEGITHGPEREEGIVGEVWYDVEDGCWAIGCWEDTFPANSITKTPERRYRWYYQFSDRIDRETLTVIGNVHQNPELLT